MRSPRQFIVTHADTGQRTVVSAWTYGSGGDTAQTISRKAGHHAPADSTVQRVPRGQEYPLPFDTLPMIIRRPDAVKAADAA